MTRAAPYGSYAWRNWKQNHHWASTGPSDPLGAGNTALITALAVTPKAFYDVRKNLTLNGSNVSSLADVSGVGTYGPALVQATAGSQPPWDGTTINFAGGTANSLLSAAVVTGLDLSTQLTCAVVADVQGTGIGTVAAQVGAAAGAAPWWRVPSVGTGPVFDSTSDKTTSTTTKSTAATGTGNIRCAIFTINVGGGTAIHTIEVPSTAKATSGSGTGAEASGNQLIALGGTTAGNAGAAMRFRALIVWSGGYTTAQRDTLKTWATTYHGELLA